MVYVKTNWVSGVTPLSEANMDHLETQYDEITTDLTAHKTNAAAPGVHRWTANKLLLGAGAGANPTEIDFPARAIYGDGSDGDVTIAVDTTLTRDMFYNNLTINIGITLNPGGYRIFVKNTLTLAGSVSRRGNPGANGTIAGPGAGGGALAAGSLGGSAVGGNGGWSGVGGGNAGGGGGGGGGILVVIARIINLTTGTIEAPGGWGGNGYGGTAGAGAAGAAGAANPSIGGPAAGAGGAAGLQAGGAAGGHTAPTPAQGGWHAPPFAIMLKDESTRFVGGPGGGGGASSNNAGGAGGGGGGAGGCVVVIYNSLTGILSLSSASGGTGVGDGSNGGDGDDFKLIAIPNAT